MSGAVVGWLFFIGSDLDGVDGACVRTPWGVVTAAHCVPEGGRLGRVNDTDTVHVLHQDRRADIAVLSDAPSLATVKLGQDPRAGDRLDWAGLDSVWHPVVQPVFARGPGIATRAPSMMPGVSGAPYLLRGELVGVHLGVLKERGHLPRARFAPVSVIRRVLQESWKDDTNFRYDGGWNAGATAFGP